MKPFNLFFEIVSNNIAYCEDKLTIDEMLVEGGDHVKSLCP